MWSTSILRHWDRTLTHKEPPPFHCTVTRMGRNLVHLSKRTEIISLTLLVLVSTGVTPGGETQFWASLCSDGENSTSWRHRDELWINIKKTKHVSTQSCGTTHPLADYFEFKQLGAHLFGAKTTVSCLCENILCELTLQHKDRPLCVVVIADSTPVLLHSAAWGFPFLFTFESQVGPLSLIPGDLIMNLSAATFKQAGLGSLS